VRRTPWAPREAYRLYSEAEFFDAARPPDVAVGVRPSTDAAPQRPRALALAAIAVLAGALASLAMIALARNAAPAGKRRLGLGGPGRPGPLVLAGAPTTRPASAALRAAPSARLPRRRPREARPGRPAKRLGAPGGGSAAAASGAAAGTAATGSAAVGAPVASPPPPPSAPPPRSAPAPATRAHAEFGFER